MSNNYEEELYHYGKLGMRRGIRRRASVNKALESIYSKSENPKYGKGSNNTYKKLRGGYNLVIGSYNDALGYHRRMGRHDAYDNVYRNAEKYQDRFLKAVNEVDRLYQRGTPNEKKLKRLVDNSELKHYGIPGMKWGVRKFIERQEKGKTHRDRLQNKYLEKGYSKEEASNRAANRIRAEKALAISGGIALTAAAAYYAHHKYTTDEVISKNVDFQKIMLLPKDAKPSGNMKYLAFKRGDKKRYEGTYSQALLANKMLTFSDDKVAKVTTKFERDIKIASPKRARDTFKKLYNNDSEFRKMVTDVSGLVNENRNSGTRKQAKAFKALEKLVKGKSKNFHGKAYDGFNTTLVGQGDKFDKIRDKYYSELKKQGIDAIVDRNDKALSGYNTKRPIIMLGEVAAKHTVKEMSAPEIIAKGVREELKAKGKKIVKYLAAPAAAYQVTKQATEEYNYQMKNRKKNKHKK